jgi:hypothetical protein
MLSAFHVGTISASSAHATKKRCVSYVLIGDDDAFGSDFFVCFT